MLRIAAAQPGSAGLHTGTYQGCNVLKWSPQHWCAVQELCGVEGSVPTLDLLSTSQVSICRTGILTLRCLCRRLHVVNVKGLGHGVRRWCCAKFSVGAVLLSDGMDVQHLSAWAHLKKLIEDKGLIPDPVLRGCLRCLYQLTQILLYLLLCIY